jgi:hypothetical protein
MIITPLLDGGVLIKIHPSSRVEDLPKKMKAMGCLLIPCWLPTRFLASIRSLNDQESLPSSLPSLKPSFSLSLPFYSKSLKILIFIFFSFLYFSFIFSPLFVFCPFFPSYSISKARGYPNHLPLSGILKLTCRGFISLILLEIFFSSFLSFFHVSRSLTTFGSF